MVERRCPCIEKSTYHIQIMEGSSNQGFFRRHAGRLLLQRRGEGGGATTYLKEEKDIKLIGYTEDDVR